MKEILGQLLLAVITAVVPILTGYGVSLIRKASDHFTAKTNSRMLQDIITEVSDAVSHSVLAVNQTYVNALKEENTFTKEAHQKALEMALDICERSISSETYNFLNDEYGNITEYLKNRIEAEICKQKFPYAAELIPVQECITGETDIDA